MIGGGRHTSPKRKRVNALRPSRARRLSVNIARAEYTNTEASADESQWPSENRHVTAFGEDRLHEGG